MQGKVALVCTVYNEEETIGELLKTLKQQTRKPDEAIFVDGGSSDGTQKIIEDHAEQNDWIKLIVEEGCNIAEGRNQGIRQTDAEIIATTDGGCTLHPEWLEKLLENFPEADISAGIYQPKTDGTRFKKILGKLECPDPEKLPEDWPPSSRSQAFKKKAWKQVNGYPENLYTAEDTEFNRKLKQKGFKYQLAPEAIVYWEMRDNLRQVWKQYQLYGKGDAENNTLKSIIHGNYNAIKTTALLTLATISLTTPLTAVKTLYGAPGILATTALLTYKSWKLKPQEILNPLNLYELAKINTAMRYGYTYGFLKHKTRNILQKFNLK